MRCWLGVVVVCACSSEPKPQVPHPEHVLPMCSGQTADSKATPSTPRHGPMTMQLAPSFLDQMPACGGGDVIMPAELAVASAGYVNSKGDCEWTNGVKCHFHRGAEFVDSTTPRPEVGELHCIVPTKDAKSPIIYGTHFVCKTGSEVSQDLMYHLPCGVTLLSTLAQMMTSCDARCCDDGTLTEPTAEREKAGELDVRPDFRMCATTQHFDCNVLAGMVGREANAPHFGPPIHDGM